jgi:hypothetical protein
MINIDGVIAGNTRCDVSGLDLNRQYKMNVNNDAIVIKSIMKLAHNLKMEYKDNFKMFLDLHGHSMKKNSFTYGPQVEINHVMLFIID